MRNRIGEILEELAVIQNQRASISNTDKELAAKSVALTKEWQDLCTHPAEYLEKQEDESTKCCACSFILPFEEDIPFEGEIV